MENVEVGVNWFTIQIPNYKSFQFGLNFYGVTNWRCAELNISVYEKRTMEETIKEAKRKLVRTLKEKADMEIKYWSQVQKALENMEK